MTTFVTMITVNPNLGVSDSQAIIDLPIGDRRLAQRAEGYEATIKSGTVIFKNGDHTGALPGRLIRRRKEKPPTTMAAE